jgi:uncharacterized protein YndB with AHSA1/START domain
MSKPVIVKSFSRVFDAPRQLVWNCWTKEEHLLDWSGPHDFTNKDCSVDLKPGGDLQITMVGTGNEYPCRLVFNEIVPIEKIVCTDKVIPGDVWGSDGPPPIASSHCCWNISASKPR